jgi:hypothetical protein
MLRLALLMPLLLDPTGQPRPAPEPGRDLPPIQVAVNQAAHRVDVRVGGQPFTSYRWEPALAKPVLYPLRTASGHVLTRGFPLDVPPLGLPPGAEESKDHPHHIGLWFNYGDVAGVDFWGNSAGLRGAAPGSKQGQIVHRKIERATGGAGQGELAVTADWVMPDGKPALGEQTRFLFAAAAGRRVIDRIATLTAAAGPVSFPDNKEGMLGLRLARVLEHPGRKNPDGTGQYRSSEGKVGDDVWGTRARWVMLTGKLAGQPVTVAILDHPQNPGHPTYWHARGYGLFAANPLGARAFSKGAQTMNFVLSPGKPARFAYRVLVLDQAATPEAIEAEWRRFVSERR